MPSGDSRKEFILATTGNFFGLQVSDPALEKCAASNDLNCFLDDGGTSVLVGKLDGKKVIFSKQVQLEKFKR
jgi:dynein heavy chain 2